MRRLACLVATGLVLLLAALAPATASAAPSADSGTQPSRLKITVGSMTPQVVGANDTTFTITGTLTNVGDRGISGLQARLQLGPAATSEANLSSAAAVAPTDHLTPWTTIDGMPQPGQSLSWSLTVPLAGSHSLGITDPGVYPLLVNINGSPDYGGQTRLAAVPLLLPVLAAPHGPPVGRPATPGKVTMLWPIMDTQPRLIGNAGGGVVLADDGLSTALAPGGRLYNLVNSVATVEAATPGAPPAPDSAALRSALCFAIDPQLLAEVTGMATGYQVRTSAGNTVPGRGQSVAKQWLALLRQVTSGQCVLAVPYADADLVALSHAGDNDLMGFALNQSATVAGALPGARMIGRLAWPADGTLDGGTLATLAKLGINAVLLASNATQPSNTGTASVQPTGTRAVAVDQLTSSALAGAASPTDTTDGMATAVDLRGVSTQGGLATLIYRAAFDPANRQVLVAPPRRWDAPESQLVGFLRAAQALFAGQLANPTPLTGLVEPAASTGIGSTATAGSVTLDYPPSAASAEVSTGVTTDAVRLDGKLTDLLNAMNADHATPLDPSMLINPLRLGLASAVSSAWRGGSAGADDLVNIVDANTAAITSRVTVQQSELTISLAARDSQVPVAVHNALPVDIYVRPSLTDQVGLIPTTVNVIHIPANGSYTVFIPVRLTRSGQFSVQTVLTTPGGTPLGTTARVDIVSNAYGTIILVVTSIAFGVLVLLSARRIYRRIRAAKRTSAPSPARLGG